MWLSNLSWAFVQSFIVTVSAQGLPAHTDFSTFFNITTFPNEQYSNASAIMAEARTLAGADLWPHFMHRCIRTQAYPELGDSTALSGFVNSSSPFQNIFFVGQAQWSSWAIDTGNRELLLIDTLATPDEAERIIVDGLRAHGYEPSDVKHIIITHEHGDHFGGASFFQKNFNPLVYASQKAWLSMANQTVNPPLYYNYTNAVSVSDNQTLTFDNFRITIHETPGHTPGTISLFFPVVDRDVAGTSHIAGLYGGGGIPRAAADKAQQVDSFYRFSDLARANGADVLMSNHQTQDNALFHFDALRYRQCKAEGAEGCNMPNPFVIGTDAYARYLKVMGLCVRLNAARSGQSLRQTRTKREEVQAVHECEA